MVGKWNVVQISVVIVDVESAPAAIRTLHADDPFRGARDGFGVFPRIGAMQGHADNGRIVHIRIVRIIVLERPAPWPQTWAFDFPVTGDV